MADQVFWRRDNEDDRKKFALILAPLVGASRTKSFTKHEGTAYILSMQDVSPAILEDAVGALVKRGITWMPKPGDLKAECAKVMHAKRLQAHDASLPDECPTCGREKDYKGARWKEITINGVERLVMCDCKRIALKAADRVGQALELPPSREDDREQGALL